jgi:hypothetical protein
MELFCIYCFALSCLQVIVGGGQVFAAGVLIGQS